MSSTTNGQVQRGSSSFSSWWEIELEIPFEMAMDAYFVFRESSHKCSDRMANALYYGLKIANHERSDVVEVDVQYWDKGWRTWLLKTANMRPHYASDPEQIKNLEELTDLLENI